MSRIILSIVVLLLIGGCNETEESSPYSEILNQPPYQSATDSIKKEPHRDDLYFRRAVMLNSNNFPEPALADFRQAWSISKQENYAVAISTVLLDKNPRQAINFLREALKELPRSVLLQLSLARALDLENEITEALAVCSAILADQPDQVNTLLLQSDLLQKKGDSSQAITSMEKAYALVPANLQLGYKLAYLYAENTNPAVLALTDSLIKKDTLALYSDPFYVKGLYFSNKKEYTNAIKWFDQTIQRDYNYLNAYIEKGKILLEQKKIVQALEAFSLANRIRPSFADAWYWIGQCQEQLGRKEEAKENYEKAYELDNTFIEAKEAASKISSR
jgi:tetratricopeptide (TPR) repeat protein